MEIATQVIHLPDSIDHVPEELVVIYREFIKFCSRLNTAEELDRAMEQFAAQCAGVFDRFSGDQSYHQIQDAIQFVEEHLSEDLSLKRLSSEFYISTTYFSRLFRAKTGQKFSDYLATRRIERAKVLLVSTDLPVAEVSHRVGYTEPNSFARLFKAKTGTSPVQYRRQMKH